MSLSLLLVCAFTRLRTAVGAMSYPSQPQVCKTSAFKYWLPLSDKACSSWGGVALFASPSAAVLEELCSERVLVMQRVGGQSLAQMIEAAAAVEATPSEAPLPNTILAGSSNTALQLQVVGVLLGVVVPLQGYMLMVTSDTHGAHADPHPGNFRWVQIHFRESAFFHGDLSRYSSTFPVGHGRVERIVNVTHAAADMRKQAKPYGCWTGVVSST
jgi:hypothetical protein